MRFRGQYLRDGSLVIRVTGGTLTGNETVTNADTGNNISSSVVNGNTIGIASADLPPGNWTAVILDDAGQEIARLNVSAQQPAQQPGGGNQNGNNQNGSQQTGGDDDDDRGQRPPNDSPSDRSLLGAMVAGILLALIAVVIALFLLQGKADRDDVEKGFSAITERLRAEENKADKDTFAEVMKDCKPGEGPVVSPDGTSYTCMKVVSQADHNKLAKRAGNLEKGQKKLVKRVSANEKGLKKVKKKVRRVAGQVRKNKRRVARMEGRAKNASVAANGVKKATTAKSVAKGKATVKVTVRPSQ